jgi:hypothetical protein
MNEAREINQCANVVHAYLTSSSSTSKTSVAFGGIAPPAPRLP